MTCKAVNQKANINYIHNYLLTFFFSQISIKYYLCDWLTVNGMKAKPGKHHCLVKNNSETNLEIGCAKMEKV